MQTDSLFYVFCGHRTLPWPCTLGITGRTTDWPSPPAVTKAERLTLVWSKRSGCQTSSLFTPSVLSFTTPPWKTSCSEFIQMETFSTASGTAWSRFPETRCLYNSCETSTFPEALCCVLRFHRKYDVFSSVLWSKFCHESRVHPNLKIISSLTFVPNLYDFLSSVEHTISLWFCPYHNSRLQTMRGKRSLMKSYSSFE